MSLVEHLEAGDFNCYPELNRKAAPGLILIER
jgi:hypothetical protein